MTTLEYLRPTTLEEALALLQRGIPLAGGTEITPRRRELSAVIDLAELELDRITVSDKSISIGAMTTLQSILQNKTLPTVVHDVCRLQAGWNLRNMATVAGTIMASDGRSPLLTALLALDTIVHYEPNSVRMSLDEFLDIRQQPLLILKIEFNLPSASSYEQVARAPRDFPLVCAALAQFDDPRSGLETHLSIGGFGSRPIRVESTDIQPENAIREASEAFIDAGDAWASAEYRSHVAGVLVKRLLEERQRV